MSTATETFVPPVVTGQEDWNAPGLSEKERYSLYLCSREWSVRKRAIRRRAGGVCERCKAAKMDHVHHRTYARKYNEPLDDLMAVCEPCHRFIHGWSDFDPAADAKLRDGQNNSAGRWKQFNAFVDKTMADLTRAEASVWMVLFREAKGPDRTSRAALDDIAKRVGVDRKTAWRAIGGLRRRKLITDVEKGGLNKGPSTYIVHPTPVA